MGFDVRRKTPLLQVVLWEEESSLRIDTCSRYVHALRCESRI